MTFPTDIDGTWVNSAATYDAGELRRADAALFASAGIASGLVVSVDGSDVVTVTAGSVVISGEDAVAGTGVYRAGIASSATGSLTARHATNARIDLVVFRQLDSDVVGAHAAKTARIEIIAGTPSATPAVPARPSMAVELGRINVPASGGGAASANLSQRVSARPVGTAVGTTVVTVSAATSGTQAITFPTGMFSTAPKVVATPQDSSIYLVGIGSKTAAGCNIVVRHYQGDSATASITVDWHAVG